MWVNYFKAAQWHTLRQTWCFSNGIYPSSPNECSMMIPGTYAEMHKDYD